MLLTPGVFPSALKIAKIAPFHKNDSKLDFYNYQPISLLSNLVKILEKLMYTRIFKFFNLIFYPLQFDFRQSDFATHAFALISQKPIRNI